MGDVADKGRGFEDSQLAKGKDRTQPNIPRFKGLVVEMPPTMKCS